MNKLIEIFTKEIQNLRTQRGSKFLFVPRNNVLNLTRVYLFEVLGKYDKADKELLSSVLQDLIQKKILLKQPVVYSEYVLGDFRYYDIRLNTFDNDQYCRGTSTDKMESYAKALGEVFERFTLKHYRNFEIKNQNVVNAAFDTLDYKNYAQPTEKQKGKFNFYNLNNQDKFDCVEMKDIKSGKTKWLSLQAVSLCSAFLQDSKTLVFPTSNGAGAGYSLLQAQQSSLLEILHRHVFLDSWFQKETFPKIVFEENDIELQKTSLFRKVKNFQNAGFKVHLINLTTKAKIPTIICIIEKLGGWYMGGSSKYSLYTAGERALDEAFATYMWCCRQNLSKNLYYKNKNNLDNVEEDFIDTKATSKFKISAFGNSYFVNNFDKFFIEGEEERFSFIALNESTKFSVTEVLSGPLYEFIFSSDLLSEYNYFVTKYFVPEAIPFTLDEVYNTPIVKNSKTPTFTKISPFP